MKKLLISSLVLASVLWCSQVNASHALCKDEAQNPIPCEKDGGGGGIGAGSCNGAYRGICRSNYSNYYGTECYVSWCEAEPASGSACTTDTRPECYIGKDRNDDPSYVEVNVCLDFYSEFPEVAPFQRVRLARKHVGTTNAGSPVGTAEGHAAPSPGS